MRAVAGKRFIEKREEMLDREARHRITRTCTLALVNREDGRSDRTASARGPAGYASRNMPHNHQRDHAARRATDNFVEWARLLGTHSALGETFEIAGVPVASVGLAEATPNAAYITRPLRDPARVIGEAMAYFDRRALAGAVIVREGVDPAAERACEAAGLRCVITLPGMALTQLPASLPASPAWLDIRRDLDADAHALHVATDAAGFGDSVEIARQVFGGSMLDAPGYHGYTGFVDGEAVATAVLWATGDVAGVFGVSVVESHRRRGIGEAMTWHAVRAGAASGCTIASLQASAMGRSLYERMGFRDVASYRVYARPGD